MNFDLKGKKALVTGGSRGIGRAIAVKLAEAGADVAINYLRKVSSADKTAELIREQGREAMIVKANVANEDHLKNMFDEIKDGFGHLDILVSNAASGVLKPALQLTLHHWHWTMDINAGTLIPLSQHFTRIMPKNIKYCKTAL